jgi:hypothetical protein
VGQALIEAVGPWWFILAIAVAVLGVGPQTRVVTYHLFPPAKWLRQKWTDWVVKHNHQDWYILFSCPWCMPPWLLLICGGWFALSFTAVWIAWAWWLFWGWLALSYVISMVIVRDEPYDPEQTPQDEP